MSEISGSNWSETAASNNAAAPNGFPEGQAPSTLNDSGREVMSAVKKFWNRIQGGYASTGSSNAYVLTPSVALAAYVTGERQSFRANFANTGSATLNISSLGAKTIKKVGSSGKANLASGDIQSGQPVTVEYDGTDMVMVTPIANTLTDATAIVPTGAVTPYAGSTAPTGWLLCDGAAVSRSTYAALFAVISTTYGAGDESTTFNVPDLKGRVAVGADDMGGTAANRSQVSTTITTTDSSASATVASSAGLAVGMTIVSENVPAGTTITARNGTTITMSASATDSASGTAARFSLIDDAEELGGAGGNDVHTLLDDEMPSHAHTVAVVSSGGAAEGGVNTRTYTQGPGNTGTAGGDEAHPNMQPSIVLNYIIKT